MKGLNPLTTWRVVCSREGCTNTCSLNANFRKPICWECREHDRRLRKLNEIWIGRPMD